MVLGVDRANGPDETVVMRAVAMGRQHGKTDMARFRCLAGTGCQLLTRKRPLTSVQLNSLPKHKQVKERMRWRAKRLRAAAARDRLYREARRRTANYFAKQVDELMFEQLMPKRSPDWADAFRMALLAPAAPLPPILTLPQSDFRPVVHPMHAAQLSPMERSRVLMAEQLMAEQLVSFATYSPALPVDRPAWLVVNLDQLRPRRA